MYRKMTRASLLLALMIVLQSLRLFMPVPPFLSMFVIGSAVNACLLVAVETAGWQAAIVLAFAAPVIAYVQQVLPLPVLMLPVAAANIIYILGYKILLPTNRWLAIGVAAALKMAGLYYAVSWLLMAVDIPEILATVLKMMLSWPQFITGAVGGILCFLVVARLQSTRRHTAQ